MIPDSNEHPANLVELLLTAVETVRYEKSDTGQLVRLVESDNKSLKVRTMLIPSPRFGKAVLELNNWENLMHKLKNHMSEEVAQVMEKEGMDIAASYWYAFAAKSSETIRDQNNSHSSLTHLVLRNHMERTVTVKEEAKKGLSKAIGLQPDHPQQY